MLVCWHIFKNQKKITIYQYITECFKGGIWGNWQAWSDCDQLCAGGFQQRNRSCDSTELACQGVNTQQQLCNTALCPVEGI